jgi:hypothetical protein
MCNAWNHSIYCQCGWGSGNYGNSNVEGANNSFTPRIVDIVAQKSLFSGNKDNESKTCLTPCPWCGEGVYYHTNGYGDSVYFDSLGYPWQVHRCFQEYWDKERRARQTSKRLNLYCLEGFFKMSICEQKRLILIGTAQQIQNTQLGEYFIYGLTEVLLADAMGLSIENLRHIYGDLYFVNFNGIGFLTDKQKRIKLLKAANKVPNVTIGQFLVYNLTEESLANEMSISLKCLREVYGYLYVQERYGIKFFTEHELEIKDYFRSRLSKRFAEKIQAINANKTAKLQKKERSQLCITNKPKSRPLVICPHCKIKVRHDRLAKHISIKCVINNQSPN